MILDELSFFRDDLSANPDVAVDISALLAKRRAALSHAEADLTTRISAGAEPEDSDLSQRILDRIRSYFGL